MTGVKEEGEKEGERGGPGEGRDESRRGQRTYLDSDLVLLFLGLLDNSLGSLGDRSSLSNLLLGIGLWNGGGTVNLGSYLSIDLGGTSLGVGGSWLLLDLSIS